MFGHKRKPIVVVESPYRGVTGSFEEITRNMEYLDRCFIDCITRGEVPIASHKLYTSALDDTIDSERDMGIELGYALWEVADKVVLYDDLGYSTGMKAALRKLNASNIDYEIRSIGQ